MRLQQRAVLSTGVTNQTLELGDLVEFFPTANSKRSTSDGRDRVFDAEDLELGYVIQTLPMGDDIIGFSGPTNVLIAFSKQAEIIGLKILSSGDTRDHVRQVIDDEQFLRSLNGLTADQAKTHDYDAVAGATLTSLAIRQSIAVRLGNNSVVSLRFPDPPRLDAVRILFPMASRTEPVGGSVFRVLAESDREIGTLLRSSPAAENIVGYQGPTDGLIGFDADGKVIGVAVGDSFDNQPYVGYVRGDEYFRNLFNGRYLKALADFDLLENEVEGVSGATMTSMAVAESIVVAAKDHLTKLELEHVKEQKSLLHFFSRWSVHDWGTALCVVVGTVIGFSRLRRNRRLGVLWNVLLVGYLGLVAGSLLSQAMFVGWATHGIPLSRGLGLIVLTVAAICVPIATRRNLYCSHLCPHGAAQQLLKNRLPFRWSPPARIRSLLRLVPGLLLLWCVIVGMSDLTFSLVDIEPFDAWVFRVAGWATITIAIAGLTFSLFIPMAYCRFGCPTGAMLEFLRFNAKADHWMIRDWIATSCLALGLIMYLWI